MHSLVLTETISENRPSPECMIFNTEGSRNKASANSVSRSIRHVFQSPNFFLLFSLVKHSANKAFGNKANPAIRHNFLNPLVTFYSAIGHFPSQSRIESGFTSATQSLRERVREREKDRETERERETALSIVCGSHSITPEEYNFHE